MVTAYSNLLAIGEHQGCKLIVGGDPGIVLWELSGSGDHGISCGTRDGLGVRVVLKFSLMMSSPGGWDM